MNYDSVILELMTRVQAAEQAVKKMEESFAAFKAEVLEKLAAEEHLKHTISAFVRLGQIAPAADLFAQGFVGRLCLAEDVGPKNR